MSIHEAKCPWGELSVGRKVLTPTAVRSFGRQVAINIQFNSIIRNEDDVGGRATVTRDEERVLRAG